MLLSGTRRRRRIIIIVVVVVVVVASYENIGRSRRQAMNTNRSAVTAVGLGGHERI